MAVDLKCIMISVTSELSVLQLSLDEAFDPNLADPSSAEFLLKQQEVCDSVSIALSMI